MELPPLYNGKMKDIMLFGFDGVRLFILSVNDAL
jgi:hypothetical protein